MGGEFEEERSSVAESRLRSNYAYVCFELPVSRPVPVFLPVQRRQAQPKQATGDRL